MNAKKSIASAVLFASLLTFGAVETFLNIQPAVETYVQSEAEIGAKIIADASLMAEYDRLPCEVYSSEYEYNHYIANKDNFIIQDVDLEPAPIND